MTMASSLLPQLALTLTLSLLLLSLPTSVRGDSLDDLWSKYMQQTETKKYESTISRRERNLDHWNVATAAAYLGLHPDTLLPLPERVSQSSDASGAADASDGLADEYVGHDAAVLFYAQWCTNCHSFAPSWDAVATHLNAGTRSSGLVMALFDCEKNTRHAEVCLAAGVKAYPTVMYVGSGEIRDTDPLTRLALGRDRSAGPFGASTLRRTVKFQGNWQYADQVLDWVSMMGGMSRWHAMAETGPLRGLRDGMLRLITGGKYGGARDRNGVAAGNGESLPVGVPPDFQAGLRGTDLAAAGTSAAGAKEIEDLRTELNATADEKKLYERAVAHSGHLIEGLLFSDGGNAADAPRDPFAILTDSGGWHRNSTAPAANAPRDEHPSILRSCALEQSIDYCDRVARRSTDAYIAELAAIPESDPFPTLEEIEARLLDDVRGEEPFCGALEGCIAGDFEDAGCRVAGCPFENGAACRYVESCLDPRIQDEYGVGLGLISEGEKVWDMDWGGVSGGGGSAGYGEAHEGASDGKSGNIGGWGVPAR